MTVRILLFASLRERAGQRSMTREIAAGTTVGHLLSELRRELPALGGAGRISLAVNEEYCEADHELHDGDEIALIPPVSGGQEPTLLRLTSEPIRIDDLLGAVRDPTAGAVVLFVGTTRDHNEGRRVERLEYETYPRMAEKEIQRIAAEATARWPIARIAVVHRTGVVPIGEASVAIAASSSHRADAFAAARFTIDRLKEVVPIWKKEFFEGGAHWIGDQSGREGTWQPATAAKSSDG